MVTGLIACVWFDWFNLPVHRFSPTYYAGGAYLTVNNNVGSLIDWVSWKIM